MIDFAAKHKKDSSFQLTQIDVNYCYYLHDGYIDFSLSFSLIDYARVDNE